MEVAGCNTRKEQQQCAHCRLTLDIDELFHKIGVNQKMKCSETHMLIFLCCLVVRIVR